MQQCAEHVAYQLPNKHTQAGYLIDNIQHPGLELQAALALVHSDGGAQGKQNDFKATAAHILPANPVVRKCKSSKQ